MEAKKTAGGARAGAGRKKSTDKRHILMNFKVTEVEKELIKEAKGKLPLADFILKKIKNN